jgi:hypothetical protein
LCNIPLFFAPIESIATLSAIVDSADESKFLLRWTKLPVIKMNSTSLAFSSSTSCASTIDGSANNCVATKQLLLCFWQ